MEEGLAAKLLFPWAGRHLDILTGSLRAVFSATGGFGFPAVVHFGNCICHVAYYLDVFISLLFFFFKELQISAGFQELSLAERGGRRRDFHDLGVNTRQNLDHVKESKTGRLIIKNKCHEITFQVHRTVN